MTHLARLSRVLLLLLVAIPFVAGCYTVLRHPNPDAMIADDSGARRACGDCHVDAELYNNVTDPHDFALSDHYWSYPGYRDYYFRPWWYRDFWYFEPGPGDPVETGGQHMWGGGGRREIGTPSATPFPGSSGSGAPTGTSPSSGGATQPASGSTPSPQNPPGTRSQNESHRSTGRRDIGTPAVPKKDSSKSNETQETPQDTTTDEKPPR